MSFRFDLASFEFHSSSVVPVASRNRRFIMVAASPAYRCEQLLCDSDGHMLLATETHPFDLGLPVLSEHYLGVLNGEDLWVQVLSAGVVPTQYQWLGLRSQLEICSVDVFQLAGRALQVAQWFYDHRFCGRCGQETHQDDIDRAKICTPCELRFYPRISPCMIVLVTRGEELLLAHHQRATRVMYSTLAGFVEAGESVEDCVRREIMEEVGIKVGKLEYFRSQPWPFPGQLMLGFFADYDAGDIHIDPMEIVDAKWFRYDQLPQTPAPASVAGQLIRHYIERLHQINSHH